MDRQHSRRARKSRRDTVRPRPPEQWPTAISRIAPNEVEVRGFAVDELMGRIGFGEAIYLLLRGELPTPSIGRLFGAVLVASIDHGVTPPSTLAARNVATTGAPLKNAVAAGIMGFGPYHGGDVESALRFLQYGLALTRAGRSLDDAAGQIVQDCLDRNETPPGFGHRIHERDPRATRLCQLTHELELEGEHCRLLRSVERALNARTDRAAKPVPLNLDGAIAAICGDLGFEAEVANGLFIIARVPGLLAHAAEERDRYKSMRQIDPKDAWYDGPSQRRLPGPKR